MSRDRQRSAETADNPARPDSFLGRWSRRKWESRLERNHAPVVEANGTSVTPLKALTDADMPSIESLDEQSDFSAFLSPGVSEELRRRALRKLFTLPSVNQRCPLDSEYYDCHGGEPLGNIVTHEMREELERVARELEKSRSNSAEGSAAGATAGANESAASMSGAADAPTTSSSAEEAKT